MPRKTVSLPRFGLPYPLTSRIGRQHVDDFLGAYAGALGGLYARGMQFGDAEVGAQVDPLIDLYGRAMHPAEGLLSRHKGTLDVLNVAAQSYADRQLMRARDTLASLADRMPGICPGGVAPVPLPGFGAVCPPPAFPPPRGPGFRPGFGPGPEPIPPPAPCPPPAVQCPAPVVQVQCPQCNFTAICQVQVTYIVQIVNQVVVRVLNTLNIPITFSPTVLNNVINNITVQTVEGQPPPTPPPPGPAPGTDCDHPLFVVQCVPAPRGPVCPA